MVRDVNGQHADSGADHEPFTLDLQGTGGTLIGTCDAAAWWREGEKEEAGAETQMDDRPADGPSPVASPSMKRGFSTGWGWRPHWCSSRLWSPRSGRGPSRTATASIS
jgi:hypothetical protein